MWRQAPHPNELWHHGIKGQHWGVKHGPPYPLNEKTSSSIKKKGIKEGQKKYKERQDKIRSGKLKRKASDNIGSQYLGNEHEQYIRENYMKYGPFTEEDQEYFNDNAYDGYAYDRLIVSDQRFAGNYAVDVYNSIEKTGSADRFKPKFDINNPDGTITDTALKRVNRGRFGQEGYTNNCTKNTAALALQQFGIDCQAGGSSMGMNRDAFGYWFDGAEKHSMDSNSVDSELSRQGAGAFGNIGISYTAQSDVGTTIRTGGHSVFYKVDNNGKVKYYDGQIGKTYNTYKELVEENHADPTYKADSYRLDKSKPNIEHMWEDNVFTAPGTNTVLNEHKSGFHPRKVSWNTDTWNTDNW